MPYKILSDGDLRILVAADSLPELFIDSAKGMEEVLKPNVKEEKRVVERTVILHARNAEFLLVEFLNKILSFSEIYHETYTKIEINNFSKTFLDAKLEGESVNGFRRDVKAITFREEGLEEKDGKWRARLFFEI